MTYRALVRLFTQRFFDTDLLSARGEASSLLSQAAALLAAFSFLVVLLKVPQYADARYRMTLAQIHTAAWADQEFLVATTIAVIAVCTLLLWDSLFLDKRDCTIIGALPVRTSTLFGAKAAALGRILAIAIAATNSFTGLVYPFLVLPPNEGLLGALWRAAAYWIVMTLAGAFAFLFLVALHGAAANLLSRRLFVRASNWLQTGLFFAVLAAYFLAPPLANPRALANPANAIWYECLPSYWFLGLFQTLVGSTEPAMRALAARAIDSLGVVAVVAGVVYVLSYTRQIRRTQEQPDVEPRRSAGRAAGVVARVLARRAPERAALGFVLRTVSRSRQHRSILAVYTGLALAYVFNNIAYMLYTGYRPSMFEDRPLKAALEIPLVFMFFGIIGLRVSFSMPVELRANWIFRLAPGSYGDQYVSAARKSLLAIALVASFCTAAVASVFWPWQRALGHALFVAALGGFIVELALAKFNKAPFTCAYTPGRGNLKLMFGVYWALLIALTDLITAFEAEAFKTPAGYAKLLGFTLLFWGLAYLRGRRLRSSLAPLTFDDPAEPAVASLGLVAGERAPA